MKKQLIISLTILLLIVIGTAGVILYGSGYRFGLDNNGKIGINGTGLLVATSDPDGAQVFINDHLTTATDNTLNLPPGTYKVKIYKEGYFPWEKYILVKKEVVSKAEALLFPTAPKLESITTIGVSNPTIDPSFTRLAYTVSSQTLRKNGIYVMDMTQRPVLTLQSSSTQLADDTLAKFSQSKLSWSPDGRQLLATLSDESSASENKTTYLLSANAFNENPQDVTATLLSVQTAWNQDQNDTKEAQLKTLKSPLRKLIAENFQVISWSPDQTKILYIASQSATLPVIITPRHLGIDTLQENRNVKEGNVYVYDTKDDVNHALNQTLISTSSEARGRDPQRISPKSDLVEMTNPLIWMPDSKHLIYVHDKKIDIVEYEGTNVTTVYAGPFIDNYVFPWPNGSKLVILTDLGNKDIPANLYTISLK